MRFIFSILEPLVPTAYAYAFFLIFLIHIFSGYAEKMGG